MHPEIKFCEYEDKSKKCVFINSLVFYRLLLKN